MTFHRIIGGCAGLLAAGTVLAAGCSSARQSGTRAPSSSLRTLFADEIEAVRATDAYQAVSRLRPAWLRRRGVVSIRDPNAGEVVVYLDGARFGGPRSLASIKAESIVTIEYLDPSDATARFGTGHLGGVILVRTR